jgi:capsular exopolysaccharide synthesis family protein
MSLNQKSKQIDKSGSPTQAATVITVSPGKAEQLASLTSACSTSGVELAPSASPDVTPPAEPMASQPGRALRPIVEVAPPRASILATASRPLAIQPSVAASPASTEITPLRMFQAFRRCWTWAVGLGMAAAAIAFPVAYFTLPTAKYTAAAQLRVMSHAPVVAFPTAETQEQAGDDYNRYQKTQIALLTSRMVLSSALQKPDVGQLKTLRGLDDPVPWLRDHLDVSFTSDSEILYVGLKGDYPEELAKLVNAVTEAYMEEVVNFELSRRTERYDMLTELNKRKLKNLKSQRERVRNLAESLGSNNPQALVLMQQLKAENQSVLDKELLGIRSEKRRTEAELSSRLRLVETVAQNSPPPADDAQVEELLDREPGIAALLQQLADAEHALSQHTAHLSKTARNPAADPAINQLKGEVRLLRNELKERRRALRPTVIKKLQGMGDERAQDPVTILRRRLQVLEDLENRIEAERKQLDMQAKTDNTRNLDLQTANDDIEQGQNAANRMGAEIQSLEIELQAPRRVQVIDKAVIPTTNNWLRRASSIALATLGAFLAAAFAMTFWELQSQKLSSATEIAGGLGLNLIATLPIIPVRPRRRGSERTRSQELVLERVMYESVDVTRTMLLNATSGQTARVVTITSAISGEGKTSLSCHLATSLARSGHKTLLIDADLRNPSINRLFDQPLDPGLSDLLRGELPLHEAIVSSSLADLDLLPAGTFDTQAMRSLAQGSIVPILALLRERYDCLIIDTAPVLPITDTLLIAPHTDAVILAVLTDVSQAHKVTEAHRRLITIGATVLGAVFTGDRANAYERSYRYYNQHETLDDDALAHDQDDHISDTIGDTSPTAG